MFEKKVKKCPLMDTCKRNVGQKFFNDFCRVSTRIPNMCLSYEYCSTYKSYENAVMKAQKPKKWDKELK